MTKHLLPQPERRGEGATILGPRNEPLERENPDLLTPPPTDAGTVPNLKFSYADSHVRMGAGGWTREITVRELPVATELAGLTMRLTPGGIREPHWRKEAEWSYMIAGSARVTLLDTAGRMFVDDVHAVPDHRLVRAHADPRPGQELPGRPVDLRRLAIDVDRTRYMFAAPVPPDLGEDTALMPSGPSAVSYTYRFGTQTPLRDGPLHREHRR